MKYLPLIFAGLRRKPMRSIFTFLSVMVAFILFGVLSALQGSFDTAVENSRLDRLFVDLRAGKPMPSSYAAQVARIPGVTLVAPRSGLFGTWREQQNGVSVLAGDERFLQVRPELQVSPQDLEKWHKTRTGVLVSESYARRYGWKAGDRIPLNSPVTAKQDGSKVWTFDIVAIVKDLEQAESAFYFLAHYDYIDEARAEDKGTIARIIVRIDNPERWAQVASAIDQSFANSPIPTRTMNEKSQWQGGFMNDVKYFVRSIIMAVLFMILFLTGNTMMQSVRERTSEFAVLKTLGFSDTAVLLFVFAETLILCMAAGAAGLLLTKLAVVLIKESFPQQANLLLMRWSGVASGFGAAALLALISGLIPALRVKRLKVVDALAGR